MKTALLIIDMINTLDFPEGGKLLRHAIPAAHAIAKLKKKMRRTKSPVIYVNDCFGHWKDNWEDVFAMCSEEGMKGAILCGILPPEKDDYFVLKPKHSAFFGSSLEVLLKSLKVDKLIVTGIAGNICVLFTVNDAYMRGYKIHVPANAIASETRKDNESTLRLFKNYFKIKTDAA
jgi:nicotinamidase-related amidase